MGNLVNQVNTAFGSQIQSAEEKVTTLSNQLNTLQASLVELIPKISSAESSYKSARKAEQSKYDQCSSINLKTDGVNRLNINKKKEECFNQQRQMKAQADQLQATYETLKSQKQNLEGLIASTTESYNKANEDLTAVRTAYNDALQKAQEQERVTEAQNTQNQIDLGTGTNIDLQKKKIEEQAKVEIEKAKQESASKGSNTTVWIIAGVVLIAIVVTVVVIVTKKS
jgi:chromosome segregation ATPase